MRRLRAFSGTILLPTFCAILFVVASAIAHPGTGIVRDSRGNIFYTDLQRVWKIAPSGEQAVAVQNVHTHELYVDSLDNLYGEHLWYEGERTGRWGHRVWRLSPEGILTDRIPSRSGFRDDHDEFHFDWDRRGRMYWFDRGQRSTLRRRDAQGRIETLVENVRGAGRIAVSAEGVVYYLEGDDLRSVDGRGKLSTLVRSPKNGRSSEHFVGLWLDDAGNVYLSRWGSRLVKRVNAQGGVDDLVRSEAPWGPVGGLVDPSGILWLLETSDANAVRLRALRNGQTLRSYGPSF